MSELYKAGVFTPDGTRDKSVKKTVNISDKNITDYLGKVKYRPDKKNPKGEVGIVRGLAWTQAGGEILFIEAVETEGEGKIQLTGQLGDVMKESAELAFTLAKAHLAEYIDENNRHDVHIHVPEGAVPKDGPSAGVTMFTALTSLILKKPAKKKLAMTGEISLRGDVLPIGGLPEKLMAAQRAGIQTVLIPAQNEEYLKDVAQEIMDKLTIIPVATIQEVVKESLGVEI